jgi:hypothetical protein
MDVSISPGLPPPHAPPEMRETPWGLSLKSQEIHVFCSSVFFFYRKIDIGWEIHANSEQKYIRTYRTEMSFYWQKEECYQRGYMFLYRIGVYQMRFEADLTIVKT